MYKTAENGTNFRDPVVLASFEKLANDHGFSESWYEDETNYIKCDSWYYDDTFGVTGLTENDWACPGSAQQNLQVLFPFGKG